MDVIEASPLIDVSHKYSFYGRCSVQNFKVEFVVKLLSSCHVRNCADKIRYNYSATCSIQSLINPRVSDGVNLLLLPICDWHLVAALVLRKVAAKAKKLLLLA